MKRIAWINPLIALLAFTVTDSRAATLLVLNKADATLDFIEPSSSKIVATVATGNGPHEVELSSDGRLAFVSNYGTGEAPGSSLSVIDVATRKELRRVDLGELGRPHGLSFSGGHLYFTSEASKHIGRYDPVANRVDWKFATGQDGTHMVLASRDGKRLFASNIAAGSVGIVERGSADEWKQTLITVGAGPEGLDESPDGRQLWSAHSRDGKVSIIDVASKRVIETIDVQTKRSNRLKFTPDGKLVLISDLGGSELVIVDVATRKVSKRLPTGRMPEGILLAPDGLQAYVAIAGEDHIGVVDLKRLTFATKIATGKGPDGMAWIP